MKLTNPFHTAHRLNELIDEAHANAAGFDQDKVDEALSLIRVVDSPERTRRLRLSIGVAVAVSAASYLALVLMICAPVALEHRLDWVTLFVMIGAIVIAVSGLMLSGDIRRACDRSRSLFQPISDDPPTCHKALKLVKRSSAAARLRDLVVSRAEELRQFHYDAMRQAEAEEHDLLAQEESRAACKELHAVAGSEPMQSSNAPLTPLPV